MSNEFVNVNGAEVEVAQEESSNEVSKPKRSRVKPKKTGAEIIAEIEALKVDVAQLEEALDKVEAGNVIHELATKELLNKRQQLEDSLNTTYTFS